MTVHFNTFEYEASHGKRPRGFGCWAFFFHHTRRIEEAWFVNPACSYSDAEKAAAAEAKKRGVREVFVGA